MFNIWEFLLLNPDRRAQMGLSLIYKQFLINNMCIMEVEQCVVHVKDDAYKCESAPNVELSFMWMIEWNIMLYTFKA